VDGGGKGIIVDVKHGGRARLAAFRCHFPGVNGESGVKRTVAANKGERWSA